MKHESATKINYSSFYLLTPSIGEQQVSHVSARQAYHGDNPEHAKVGHGAGGPRLMSCPDSSLRCPGVTWA